MKVCRLILSLVLLPLWLSAAQAEPLAQAPVPGQALAGKNILLLMSYDSTFPTHQVVIETLENYFLGSGATLRIESLDSKTLWDSNYQQSVARLINRKLENLPPPDVVIAAEDNALQLLLDQGIPALRDKPVVFLGINSREQMESALAQLPSSGVFEQPSFAETAELAHRLFPDATELVTLYDTTNTALNNLHSLQAAADAEGRIAGLTLKPVNTRFFSRRDLDSRLMQLDSHQLILLLSALQYADGATISKREAFSRIRSVSNRPIFHLWTYGADGMLGGVLVDHRQQALHAAAMALAVLRGADVRQIEPLWESPNVTAVDYRELKRFGLLSKNLGSDVEIYHQPDSFLKHYGDAILGALILVSTVLAFLLVAFWIRMMSLSLERRSVELRVSRQALQDSERKFRTMFEQAAEGMLLSDLNTGELLEFNMKIPPLLGIDRSELRNLTLPQILQGSGHVRELDVSASDDTISRRWISRADDSQVCLRISERKLNIAGRDVLLTVLADVTHEEEQNDFIDTLLRTAPIGIGTLKGGKIRSINERFCEELQYDRSQVIGKPLAEIFSAGEPEFELHDRMASHLLTRGVYESETSLRRPDGEALDVLMRFSLVNPAVPQEGIAFTVQDISERKHFDNQIRLYMDAFDQATDAILITDNEFNIQHSNRIAKLVFGYDNSQLSTMRFSNLLAPGDEPGRWEKLYTSIRADGLKSAQLRLRDRNGYVFLCESKFSSIQDPSGEQSGYLVVNQDITVRHQAEMRLRVSESRFRKLLEDNVTVAVQGVNKNGQVIYWNVAAEKLFGIPSQRVIGRTVDELGTINSTYAEVFSGLRYCLDHNCNSCSQELVLNIDGRTVSMYSQSVVLQPEQPEQELFRINVDLTALRTVEHQLTASDLRYRTLFEDIPQGVIVLQENGTILEVNRAAKDIVGSVLPHWDFNFFDYDFSLIKTVENGVSAGGFNREELIRFLQSQIPVRNIELKLNHLQTGDPVWISADVLFPKAEGQERANLIYMIFSDITQAKILQDALVHTQRMEAVGQLTGGVAHDFNNILASLIGFAELAKMQFGEQDKKLQRYLGQILSSGQRARDLVRQLLIFSRGSTTQGAEPVNLALELHELVTMLRPMLPASIDLSTKFDSPSPVAVIDPVHLQQLVMNLAINARDAVGESGRLQIRLGTRNYTGDRCELCNTDIVGDWVTISVTDNGSGISDEVRHNLFQPFVSTKETGKGTGMGLAVVSGLMNTYGGHVLIESTEGVGTVFSLLLPPYLLPAANSLPVDGELPQTQESPAVVDLSGVRILLVDDEEAIVQYLRELLEAHGLEVEVAFSAADAQKRILADPFGFDLIVTDQTMPGLSGVELIRTVREVNATVPAIVCSGYRVGISDTERETLKITTVLTKPVAAERLLEEIHKAVGESVI